MLFYWVAAFALTHKPSSGSGPPPFPHADKIAHFLLYFLLSLILAYVLGADRKIKPTVLLTLLICIIYSLVDEGLQMFVPGRTADFLDAIADWVGAVFGVLTYIIARRIADWMRSHVQKVR